MANKKKIATATTAVALAATLLFGGTFAWQSISQTALNEKEAVINPGGRLHDDFNGENKDVYVENFADDTIYARVRLDEYFEIVMNKGTGAETKTVVTEGAEKDKTDTYITHKFDDDNATDDWWNWTTGGSTVYMPTFNKNKDSLKADINGTYENDYNDYVEYIEGKEVTADATYDNDSNNDEDDGVTTVKETHTAKETGNAQLISMEDWLELTENTDNYWVYDTDGWVYWSSPISAGTATGLLLDEISLKGVMDDSYYYAINVVGQFITADDLGKDDGTGFYDTDAGTLPTDNALTLLKKIGVDVGDITADDDDDNDNDNEEKPAFGCMKIWCAENRTGYDEVVDTQEADITMSGYGGESHGAEPGYFWLRIYDENDNIIPADQVAVSYSSQEDGLNESIPNENFETTTYPIYFSGHGVSINIEYNEHSYGCYLYY